MISNEQFTLFQKMVKEFIDEGFQKLEGRMNNMEKQLADMEQMIIQAQTEGPKSKKEREKKIKEEMWHADFKGRNIKLTYMTFEIINSPVEKKRQYMRNNN
ncbi:Hypothetical protein SRAE_0000051100 [Strongyloides ratti]|uniref:Uncharacterized protein n=1 Tax=Strongyloides ratti TaxID=34506 RepID=A0A090KVD6_STRRB|nr:Hypothetical protein SRAE_0000051100 [Strongyloides ratti]CEF61386.1 Hypothetical protein SRAE_0000051100 [Strongyloides ratti]